MLQAHEHNKHTHVAVSLEEDKLAVRGWKYDSVNAAMLGFLDGDNTRSVPPSRWVRMVA